ncbi:uncharacterized protein LOC111716964 [Eurytemora carolleeae]|uniref:uncharacterized protein LOC111716964 n=1 Tax=Eurytemora carolleeae TaxID=1294199 RepID=UPI000C787A3E|nr:uncharacterized protein LOC111716964 [Eurytemora carolleeae]|eukprot:XP_023348248.1 uncharacterized protein LOC111716964 [Eurytemora affinis]
MAKSLWNLSSEVAKYALARPPHPKEIVKHAVNFLDEEYRGPKYQALDVGCGSGISTRNLFGEFQNVLGLDASSEMINQARKGNNCGSLRFLESSAETLPVNSGSVQLILSGRAIHYFNTEAFYAEVDRVLVKYGVLCYYSTHFPTISSSNFKYGEKINKIFWTYLIDRLDGHWPVNKFSGHVISWRRRDFYMNTLAPPYPDHTRTIENITQQRGTSVIALSKELETYSPMVNLREKMGDKEADSLLARFLLECEKAGEEEGEIVFCLFVWLPDHKL